MPTQTVDALRRAQAQQQSDAVFQTSPAFVQMKGSR